MHNGATKAFPGRLTSSSRCCSTGVRLSFGTVCGGGLGSDASVNALWARAGGVPAGGTGTPMPAARGCTAERLRLSTGFGAVGATAAGAAVGARKAAGDDARATAVEAGRSATVLRAAVVRATIAMRGDAGFVAASAGGTGLPPCGLARSGMALRMDVPWAPAPLSLRATCSPEAAVARAGLAAARARRAAAAARSSDAAAAAAARGPRCAAAALPAGRVLSTETERSTPDGAVVAAGRVFWADSERMGTAAFCGCGWQTDSVSPAGFAMRLAAAAGLRGPGDPIIARPNATRGATRSGGVLSPLPPQAP
eukprot:360465-Chlamydomonas_euryale.AAC.10